MFIKPDATLIKVIVEPGSGDPKPSISYAAKGLCCWWISMIHGVMMSIVLMLVWIVRVCQKRLIFTCIDVRKYIFFKDLLFWTLKVHKKPLETKKVRFSDLDNQTPLNVRKQNINLVKEGELDVSVGTWTAIVSRGAHGARWRMYWVPPPVTRPCSGQGISFSGWGTRLVNLSSIFSEGFILFRWSFFNDEKRSMRMSCLQTQRLIETHE